MLKAGPEVKMHLNYDDIKTPESEEWLHEFASTHPQIEIADTAQLSLAFNNGFVRGVKSARQSKGSAEQQTDNSNYTAALNAVIKQFMDDRRFWIKDADILELATRLNAALQKQHCA